MTETTNMSIEIPKELNRQVKALAAIKGKTLKQFVNELLKNEVDINERNKRNQVGDRTNQSGEI